jgi:hypothetical protein
VKSLADKIAVLRQILRERPEDRNALEEEIEWESAARRQAMYCARLILRGRTIVESPGFRSLLPSNAVFPLAGSLDQSIGKITEFQTSQGDTFLLTAADILNVDHVDVLTASEKPMTKVFDLNQRECTFDAVPSIYLYNTQLPLPPRFAKNKSIPKREDNVNPDKFNRIVWEGLHGDKPYPIVRRGLDLRRKRSLLLKKAEVASK